MYVLTYDRCIYLYCTTFKVNSHWGHEQYEHIYEHNIV